MTASAKRANPLPSSPSKKFRGRHDQNKEDAQQLPGVLFLLRDTMITVWELRVALYGYTAWLLIPIIIYLFAQGVPSPYGNYLLLIGDLLALTLGLWVTAAIILYVAVAAVKNEDEEINFSAIGTRAWDKVFTLFIIQVLAVCAVTFGAILFVIPGIVAWVWTAFAMQEGVLHNRSTSEAFAVSRALTRGKFMAIFGRLLVANGLFVITILLVFSLYLLAGLQGSAGNLVATLYAWPHWLELGFVLIALPFTPVSLVFHLLLYFAVKKSYSAGNV